MNLETVFPKNERLDVLAESVAFLLRESRRGILLEKRTCERMDALAEAETLLRRLGR